MDLPLSPPDVPPDVPPEAAEAPLGSGNLPPSPPDIYLGTADAPPGSVDAPLNPAEVPLAPTDVAPSLSDVPQASVDVMPSPVADGPLWQVETSPSPPEVPLEPADVPFGPVEVSLSPIDPPLGRPASRLTLVAGLGLLGVGALTALGYGLLLVLALAQGAELVDRAVAFGGLAWIALGGGALLVALSPGARRDRRFGPRQPGVWLWALFLVVMAGGALLAVGQPALTALAFPVLHAAGAVVPALTVAAYIAWRAPDRPRLLTWRGVAAGLTWGGGVATIMAALAELVAFAVVAVAVYLALQVLPGGPEALAAMTAALDAAAAGRVEVDPTALLPALHPVVVVAAFAFLGVIGPAVEEVAKLTGVALRRPASALEAWAWGATTGAGFGIVEAVMFGAMGLEPAAWGAATLARACATLMHATMTGLAGLGWYRATAGGRRWHGAILIGASIVGHGAWNALVLTAVLSTLVGGTEGGSPQLLTLGSLAATGIAVGFTGIFLGFLRLTRSLAKPAEA